MKKLKVFPSQKVSKVDETLSFSKSLLSLQQQKLRAFEEIPRPTSKLEFIVNFPPTHRILSKLFFVLKRHIEKLGWVKIKEFSLFIAEKKRQQWIHRIKCVTSIQKIARGFLGRRKVLRIRENIEIQNRILRNDMARVIQGAIRRYLARNFLAAMRAARSFHQRERAAVKIQKVFRSYLCRLLQCDKERLLLVKEIRLWAHGRIQKLLARPDLQDASSQSILHGIIRVIGMPSRPLKLLPKFTVLHHYRNTIDEMRDKSDQVHNILKGQYISIRKERDHMKAEDRRARLNERFMISTLASHLEEQQAKIDRFEREKIEALRRKRRMATLNILTKLSDEESYQKSERELMLVEDIRQSRIELYHRTKSLQERNQAAELLTQEDVRSRLLRDYENKLQAEREMAQKENERIYHILDDREKNGGKYWKHSILERVERKIDHRNSNMPTETPDYSNYYKILVEDNHFVTTNAARANYILSPEWGFRCALILPRSTESTESNAMPSSNPFSFPSYTPEDSFLSRNQSLYAKDFIQSFEEEANKYFDKFNLDFKRLCRVISILPSSFSANSDPSIPSSPLKSSNLCFTEVRYKVPSNCQERILWCMKLRLVRENCVRTYRQFLHQLHFFRATHHLLVNHRHQLTRDKIPTRRQRLQIQEKAVVIESSLILLQKQIADLLPKLINLMKTRLRISIELFGNEMQSPLLFESFVRMKGNKISSASNSASNPHNDRNHSSRLFSKPKMPSQINRHSSTKASKSSKNSSKDKDLKSQSELKNEDLLTHVLPLLEWWNIPFQVPTTSSTPSFTTASTPSSTTSSTIPTPGSKNVTSALGNSSSISSSSSSSSSSFSSSSSSSVSSKGDRLDNSFKFSLLSLEHMPPISPIVTFSPCDMVAPIVVTSANTLKIDQNSTAKDVSSSKKLSSSPLKPRSTSKSPSRNNNPRSQPHSSPGSNKRGSSNEKDKMKDKDKSKTKDKRGSNSNSNSNALPESTRQILHLSIPAFEHFLVEDCNTLLWWKEGIAVTEWWLSVDRWIEEVEDCWKEKYASSVLPYVHRIQYLRGYLPSEVYSKMSKKTRKGASRKGPTRSSAMIESMVFKDFICSDTPIVYHRLFEFPAEDLQELLCYEVDTDLQLYDSFHDRSASMTISSLKWEQSIGKHPCTISAKVYLWKVLQDWQLNIRSVIRSENVFFTLESAQRLFPSRNDNNSNNNSNLSSKASSTISKISYFDDFFSLELLKESFFQFSSSFQREYFPSIQCWSELSLMEMQELYDIIEQLSCRNMLCMIGTERLSDLSSTATTVTKASVSKKVPIWEKNVASKTLPAKATASSRSKPVHATTSSSSSSSSSSTSSSTTTTSKRSSTPPKSKDVLKAGNSRASTPTTKEGSETSQRTGPTTSTKRMTNTKTKANAVIASGSPSIPLISWSLSLSSECRPTSFVHVLVNDEQWRVQVPAWMLPSAHWGKSAGKELFWRLYARERRAGIVGKYTRLKRIDDKANQIARKLCGMLVWRWELFEAFRQMTLQDKLWEYERRNMMFEDVRSKAVKISDVWRWRQQHPPNWWDRTKMRWKKWRKIYVEDPSLILTSEEVHLLSHGQSILPFSRRLFLQQYHIPSIHNPLRRLPYWIERQQQLLQKAETMKNGKDWITGEEAHDYSHLDVEFDELNRLGKDGVRLERRIGYSPAYDCQDATFLQEVWVVGGVHAPVVILRLIEDENLNPRGRAVVELMEENPSHTDSVDLSLMARSGFISRRPRCQNQCSSFADVQTCSGRYLSLSSLRQIKVETVQNELPSEKWYWSLIWKEVMHQRYHSERSRRAIVKIQAQIRRVLSCNRVRKMQKLNSEG